ncbi:MAG: SPFH domain-containing protein [Chloroflexi bacterium]|nr:SPFH domain-containing protein [Chloroflexota bacterium]
MPRIIDVVDHPNVMDDELVYREPQAGAGDFRMGSQCIVMESQAAVFVNRGQVLDALGPGAHTLSTANLPLLSSLVGLVTGGRNPFTAEVYFVNMKDLPQVRWGTNPPVTIYTQQGIGVMQLMTNGVVDIGIDDPVRFVKQYGVGRPIIRLDDLKDRIQTLLLGEISQILSQQNVQTEQDANAMLRELEGASLALLNEGFQALGMRIKAFEARPFQRKQLTREEALNLVGSKDDFFRLEELDVMRAAAENDGMAGGLAGAGLGLGIGQQMGNQLGQQQNAGNQQQMLMMQMMQQMQQMQQQMAQQNSQQPAAPQQQQPAATGAPPSNPTTPAEIRALLDNLDTRLAAGELSESIYERLYSKWESRLNELENK